MFKKIVTYRNLGSILILSKEFEPYPLPWRLQPKLTLVIKFSEYVQFISKEKTKNLLASNDGERERILNNFILNSEEYYSKLVSIFGIDISLALIKELSYAIQYNKPVTNIIPDLGERGYLVTKDSKLTLDKQQHVLPVLRGILKLRKFPDIINLLEPYTSYHVAQTILWYSLNELDWYYK